MKDQFALSADGIKIHFLTNGISNSRPPLIIVPGMMGIADHYQKGLSGIQDRLVVALTHRGLGKSGAITPGQATFAKRASDISAVVDYLALDKYYLYGFSRGVALSVRHALDFPQKVKALILHDCEPAYIKPSQKWVDFLSAKNQSHMPVATIQAYWSDAQNIDLTAQMKQLSCEVILYRGEKEGSMLPLDKLAALLPNMREIPQVVAFKNSAHEVSDADMPLFLECLKKSCLAQDKKHL